MDRRTAEYEVESFIQEYDGTAIGEAVRCRYGNAIELDAAASEDALEEILKFCDDSRF